MKLSIVIPIYNVAPYLRECVESALNQDLPAEEYELILVDDGSTDGSGAIADSLTPGPSPEGEGSNRCRVRVIHQENQGLSAARNAGIAVAEGEYIQFLDSDDYLEPNVLGGLVEQMDREHLDVLRFDYQNVRLVEGAYSIFEPNKTPRQVDQCTEIVDGETYLNTRMGYACYAVQFMMRRELLDGCLFTPGIYFEDVDWTPRMLLRARRVNATTKIVYNYLMREGSITAAANSQKKLEHLKSYYYVIQTLNNLLVLCPHCDWLCEMRSSFVEGVLTVAAKWDFRHATRHIRKLNCLGCFPLAISSKNTKTYIKRAKLINKSPLLYCMLYKLKTL